MSYYGQAASSAANDTTLFGAEGELLGEVRNLATLVGELTMTVVVQGAFLLAMKDRRATPSEHDIDAAILAVADHVPAHVAEGLWAARNDLVARFRRENAPA
jgi:hypothetical protein